MHVHDVLSDVLIFIISLLIENDEEQVEAGHDRWRNVHVVTEGLRSVITAKDWVGCSKN